MNQEDEFNRHGRVKNAGKAMTFNVVATIANRLMAFAYRLVFLHYLSAAYLGITGLFSNIILLLSFADLGIGTVFVVIHIRGSPFPGMDAQSRLANLVNRLRITHIVVYSRVFCQ